MIYDILFSLQNGFENKSLIMPYILKNTYFDSCIKIGNDIIPQKLKLNSDITKYVEFLYLSPFIIKNIPCFIGENSLLDVGIFKKEVELIEGLIDIDEYLFISTNTSFKINENIYFLEDLDSDKILNLFGFLPNICTIEEFTIKYSKSIVEGSGGLNYIDGSKFNNFKNYEISCSKNVFSYINIRQCGDIIGVINIIEISKSNIFNKKNIDILYNYYTSSDHLTSTDIIYSDFILNYNWLDLSEVIKNINSSGISSLFCIGINTISNFDTFIIKISESEKKEFKNVKYNLKYIKTFIESTINKNCTINLIEFL